MLAKYIEWLQLPDLKHSAILKGILADFLAIFKQEFTTISLPTGECLQTVFVVNNLIALYNVNML